MRTFRTLSIYLARNYVVALLWAFLIVSALILLFDCVELTRRSGSRSVGMNVIITMALYHLPSLLQLVVPFIFMSAAMLVFWRLTRSSELVIIRSAGLSAWQFLTPIVGTVLFLSVLNVALFNPVASAFFERYERLVPVLEGGTEAPVSMSSGGFWLREITTDGRLVTHALGIRQHDKMLSLQNVTVFKFDANGRFIDRIDAPEALLGKDALVFPTAILSHPGERPLHVTDFSIPTDLTLPKIQESFSSPETISFWSLPEFIRFFEASGFSAHAHRLHFQSLLASPLMILSMVLVGVAFSVSVRQRSPNWLLRVGGLAICGFAVYVFMRITYTLGISETLPTVLAAWAPPVTTLLVSLFFLFHLEDS